MWLVGVEVIVKKLPGLFFIRDKCTSQFKTNSSRTRANTEKKTMHNVARILRIFINF